MGEFNVRSLTGDETFAVRRRERKGTENRKRKKEREREKQSEKGVRDEARETD